MLGCIVICCALYLAPGNSPGSPSTLVRDEAKWAARLGLQRSYVDRIVKAAGFSDQDQIRIESLDVRHLRAHKHILLVTVAGNGHCLTLTVVAQKPGSMEKIWEVSETPTGGGFCHSGAYTGNFKATATGSGKIIIDVPKDENGQYVLDVKRLVYGWNGETYVLDQRQGN